MTTLAPVSDFVDDFDHLVGMERLGAQINAGCDALDANEVDRAIDLLTVPAEAEIDVAMFNLAVALKRKGDIPKAIKWYTKAAEFGDLDAIAYLGYVYKLLGDAGEAAKWYARAAGHGHANAGTELTKLQDPPDNASVAATSARHVTLLMAEGAVANNNLDQAVEYWMMAADLGDAESMVKVAVASEVRRDFGEAILWYAAAERAGLGKVTSRLNELAPGVRHYAKSGPAAAPTGKRRPPTATRQAPMATQPTETPGGGVAKPAKASAKTTVVVLGPTQKGMYRPQVKVRWNNTDVGVVDHGGRIIFQTDADGVLVLKHLFRTARLDLRAGGSPIRIQLSWERPWGRLVAVRVLGVLND